MIPRTYPSQVNSTTGRVEMKVSFISDLTGLTRWIDYIPVSFVTDATPTEGSYDNDGYIAVVDVGSTSGLQAGKDYIRVYLDSGSSDAWQVNSVGYIPVGYSGIGGIPYALFANSEPGVWYDPSDLTTLYQDSAGTTPVTAVEQPVGLMLDKSGNGFHAYQTTSTSRPVLSARYNLLVGSDTLATQNVTTVATNYTLSFTGTGSVTLSGTATGTLSAGSNAFTATAGTLTLTVSGTVTNAQLTPADQASLPYQRVNTSTDYDADATKFPAYLKFDGVDDWLVTNTITPGTDKAQVFAGVRKLSDAAGGVVFELGTSATQAGSARIYAGDLATAAGAYWSFESRGTLAKGASTPASYPAPITSLVCGIGDISGDQAILRVNGTQAAANTGDQGTGNYLAYPLYIGRRGGTTLPFNGWLTQLIVRFGATPTDSVISATETYVNNKTKAY